MNGSKRIDWLVLYATENEGALVQKNLQQTRRRRLSGVDFHLGWWPKPGGGRLRMALAACGIGQANAAGAAGIGLGFFRPRNLASIGVAGGYKKDGWEPGMIARGVATGLGDEGVALDAGWDDLATIGIPLTGAAAPPVGSGWNRVPFIPATTAALVGREAGIVTVAACSGDGGRAKQMRQRAAQLAGDAADLPWVEDMETAAVALCAQRAGAPFLALRGISNLCGDRDPRHWQLAAAAQAAQAALAVSLCGPTLAAALNRPKPTVAAPNPAAAAASDGKSAGGDAHPPRQTHSGRAPRYGRESRRG